MSWLRVDDKMPRHPKVAPLSDAAFRLHFAALAHCAEYETDGHIDHATVQGLTRHKNKSPLIKELESAKGIREDGNPLWKKEPSGWELHDYLQWNSSHAELDAKRKQAKERMEALRGGRSVRKNGSPSSHVGSREHSENISPSSDAPRARDHARAGAPAGRASGSGDPESQQYLSDEARRIAEAIEAQVEFRSLDAREIAERHTGYMLGKPQQLSWVLTAVEESAAKVESGIEHGALKRWLVGCLRNARRPKDPEPPPRSTVITSAPERPRTTAEREAKIRELEAETARLEASGETAR